MLPTVEISSDHHRWFHNLPDNRLFVLFMDATRISRTLYYEGAQHPLKVRQLMPSVADLIERVKSSSTDSLLLDGDPRAHYVEMVNSVWRMGLLCYIYSDICVLPSTDARIQECVRLGSLALDGLPWIQHAQWPAVMIGVHATDKKQRDIFTTAFSSMRQNLKFLQALTVLDFFEKVWQELDVANDPEPGLWQRVLQASKLHVNIFL